MFVAVVYQYHYDTDPISHRDTGGWEAFLGHTKEEAINQALLWARRWETQPKVRLDGPLGESKVKYYGPYTVIVGQITEEAKATQYELVRHKDKVLF